MYFTTDKFLIYKGILYLYMRSSNDFCFYQPNTNNYICFRFNCVETAKLLIQRGANPALASTNGSTALHFAARRGNEEVAELLVHRARADVNSQDSAHMTALHLACVSGNAAISKTLLEQGANIRAKSTELMTPLHTAVYNGNSEVAALILRVGRCPRAGWGMILFSQW